MPPIVYNNLAASPAVTAPPEQPLALAPAAPAGRAWNAFEPIPPQTTPAKQREADVLTLRIAQLLTFRATVDRGEAFGQFYTVDDAVNEAMRRELMLRLDIREFTKRQDPLIAEVDKWLTDNGGHRSCL
jgi:hypothetical protein